MTTQTLEQEYIPKELFGMFAQNMRDRAASNETVNNARFDKLETLIKSSAVETKAQISALKTDIERLKEDMSEMKADIKQNREDIMSVKNSVAIITGDVKLLGERLSHEVKGLSDNQRHIEQKFEEKLDHAIDTLTVAISGNEKRLEDFRDDLQAEQNKSLTKLGIRVALFIGAVQVAVSVILHFWSK